jgi:hypothetical protein
VGSSSQASSTSSVSSAAFNGFKGDEDDDDTRADVTGGKKADKDADFDNDSTANRGKGYRDEDDDLILNYGQAANATDEKAVAALVKRYYVTAVAGDGEAACKLMLPLYQEAVVEDYGSGAGPAYTRGKTCGVVMTKVFRHDRHLLSTRFVVTDVRVKGEEALAVLGSKTIPASYIDVHRQDGGWRINGLLASALP